LRLLSRPWWHHAQTTASSLETVRSATDARLAQTVVESRQGRAGLLAAFQGFEGKLEQRLAGSEQK